MKTRLPFTISQIHKFTIEEIRTGEERVSVRLEYK